MPTEIINDDPNHITLIIPTKDASTPVVTVPPVVIPAVVAPVIAPGTIPPSEIPPITSSATSSDTISKISIDNVIYTLNDSGDALNPDGTVNLTKDQIDALDTPVPPITTGVDINELIASVNYNPIDSAGVQISYEDTKEGRASYIKDVFEQRVPELAQELLANELASNPEKLRAIDYIDRYGSLAGIESNVDYSIVDVTTADEATKYNMVVAREMEKGETLAHAKMIADLMKDAKKLDEVATVAKSYFSSKAVQQAATAKQEYLDNQQELKVYWDSIHNTISSRKLSIGDQTITIPEVIKVKTAEGKVENRTSTDFYEYLSVPKLFTINGNQERLTQNQYDQIIETQNRTPQNEIFDGLKRYTKYNNEQFIVDIKKANAVTGMRTISTTSKAIGDKARVVKIS